jgi:hypothetical protein
MIQKLKQVLNLWRREQDTSSRRSSEMARHWRGLCSAVDCGRLMMMMMLMIELVGIRLGPGSPESLVGISIIELYVGTRWFSGQCTRVIAKIKQLKVYG